MNHIPKPAIAARSMQWRACFLSAIARVVVPSIMLFLCSLVQGASNSVTGPTKSTNTSHVLAVNDFVEVKVYKEDDLLTRTRVDQDGTISLPLIQTVAVAGKTIAEARELVRVLYERDYLVTASVTVTLVEPAKTNKVEVAKQKFTVSGEVKKPGIVEIPEGEKIDLVNAIALAGDFTPLANKRKVTIIRGVGDSQQKHEVDVLSMLRDAKAKPFEVFPGDRIEVRQTIF